MLDNPFNKKNVDSVFWISEKLLIGFRISERWSSENFTSSSQINSVIISSVSCYLPFNLTTCSAQRSHSSFIKLVIDHLSNKCFFTSEVKTIINLFQRPDVYNIWLVTEAVRVKASPLLFDRSGAYGARGLVCSPPDPDPVLAPHGAGTATVLTHLIHYIRTADPYRIYSRLDPPVLSDDLDFEQLNLAK